MSPSVYRDSKTDASNREKKIVTSNSHAIKFMTKKISAFFALLILASDIIYDLSVKIDLRI